MHPQHPQPAPRKKSSGCLIATIIGVVLVGLLGFGGCAAMIASSDPSTAGAPSPSDTGYHGTKSPSPSHRSAPKVTFKVSGDAPAGVDIMYGSDSDNRQGGSSTPWKATMKRRGGDTMWYQVTAQLQGGGDITCSVTIGGKTKTGHASGNYQVCSAQINAPLGGWSAVTGAQPRDGGPWQRIGARVAAEGVKAARR